MSYVDIVGKRADELAGDEWDSMGAIAQHWAIDAIRYEGSDRAYQLAVSLYTTALTGNSISADLDAMRELFIEEKTDVFYSVAEQEIKEEQQDAADAAKEEYYDRLKEEARQSGIRG